MRCSGTTSKFHFLTIFSPSIYAKPAFDFRWLFVKNTVSLGKTYVFILSSAVIGSNAFILLSRRSVVRVHPGAPVKSSTYDTLTVPKNIFLDTFSPCIYVRKDDRPPIKKALSVLNAFAMPRHALPRQASPIHDPCLVSSSLADTSILYLRECRVNQSPDFAGIYPYLLHNIE